MVLHSGEDGQHELDSMEYFSKNKEDLRELEGLRIAYNFQISNKIFAKYQNPDWLLEIHLSNPKNEKKVTSSREDT